MKLLRSLKLWWRPPQLVDPVFGKLIYIHINKFPERSRWEATWLLPNTKSYIDILLPGDESGPYHNSRQFYLDIPDKFDKIIDSCRPKISAIFKVWLEKPLPEDILSAVKVSGIAVRNLSKKPLEWNIGFETLGEKWLSITIPFIGEVPQDATVDT